MIFLAPFIGRMIAGKMMLAGAVGVGIGALATQNSSQRQNAPAQPIDPRQVQGKGSI